MMVTMVSVTMSCGESWAGKHEHEENSSENLLHGPNLT